MSHLVISDKSSTDEGEISNAHDVALPAGASAVVQQYRRQARRKILAIFALSIAAFAAFAVATIVGPIDLSLMELWKALIDPNGVDETTHTVLWNLRLPASVMAVLIGASLSLSGAHMQTILDNPLAEPFTLGISAAAAFGGAASIVLGWTVLANPQFNLAAVAWVASLVAVFIVAGASLWRGASAESMILLGIALVFLFQAMLSLMQYRATTEALQQIVFWTMGSLQRANWTSNAIIFGALAVAIPFTILNSWKLTALRLGDDRAAALGINVQRLRVTTLIVSSLLAASAVAFAGVIGFIGLVGPHVARMLVGEDQRYFAPASMAAGALLLAAAHAVSITAVPGVAVPIGIITSLVGVPFFLILVFVRRRTVWGS
ncbi:iron ABC transporter permease [Corynebacterium jeikeium]|uniref:Putative iron ABC transport system, permease protein n=1 Tax=Corynebacterium jeikeium (strain K411) TaxID=306537 RepID=Q4JWT8_CORJK|nr:iron ABC transporter permease [Corynebacterium jeikeium]EEW16861.1 iron chelate uptake ABC transporter, FeCT family, permease protein [Corynebacterium jeikeium ATCC 43734]WCZ53113.1 Hemin transport system permease protein HmuU [Corynebacterium jeikeium]CAI36719.1 putative iron ABC transport system, permease protein [Corynebacterium jeikeium K411]SUY81579.1 iron ABC transport system, permease [Corynebacterium jeikeium]SUY85926.1 iron ABC transport system, permease [Corynebacterium jeikeium]